LLGGVGGGGAAGQAQIISPGPASSSANYQMS